MSRKLLTRWIRASFAIGRIGEDPLGGHITYEIQSLGRLEVELRTETSQVELLVAEESAEPTDHLGRHLDFSRLWVLAGYELVRTLSACVSAGLWAPEQGVANRLNKALKHNFSLVRIPLAKFEPAFQGGKASPGDLVAKPVFLPGQGAGWEVAEDWDSFPKVITRRELADQLLEFLEEVRRTNPLLPNG